ncbi:YbbR domain-containing protein [Paenibacillus phyllosphaerae]|uniref:YbbR domain-containing protein n=1 Tax=Paenibacillus phyllosphaerae TaxID=274593 RepID=A0A7W5B143_9BACL|nr:CdaR family protein [Paenibacillus phyllosphaerae]MBB3111771.1 YbbR domain-containing protein [Paenibacillus phyllosphaerae]
MDKWLSHPTAIKIISLVIGILLFAVVHFDAERSPNTVATLTETEEYELNVEVTGLDTQYALRSVEPTIVKIKVQGTSGDLFKAAKEYKATVDVTGIGQGLHELPVTIDKPDTVELLDYSPRNVSVLLEPMVTKNFTVQLKTDGTVTDGYNSGVPVVTPGEVAVTLPEDRMDEVGFVGAVISIQDADDDFTENKAKIIVLNEAGEELKEAVVQPSTVEVQIPVSMPSKVLPLHVDYTGNAPEGLAVALVTPTVQQVTVYGLQEELDKLSSYDGVVADLSKQKQSGAMTVAVPLIEGIAAVEPAEITVDVTYSAAATKVLPQVPVTLSGLASGLQAKISVPAAGTVNLTVSGASNMLADVDAQDAQLIADLTELGAGTHVVQLKAALPRFVSLATGGISATVVITDGSTATGSAANKEDNAAAGGASNNTSDNQTDAATNEPASGTTNEPEAGSTNGAEPTTGGNTNATNEANSTDSGGDPVINEEDPAE